MPFRWNIRAAEAITVAPTTGVNQTVTLTARQTTKLRAYLNKLDALTDDYASQAPDVATRFTVLDHQFVIVVEDGSSSVTSPPFLPRSGPFEWTVTLPTPTVAVSTWVAYLAWSGGGPVLYADNGMQQPDVATRSAVEQLLAGGNTLDLTRALGYPNHKTDEGVFIEPAAYRVGGASALAIAAAPAYGAPSNPQDWQTYDGSETAAGATGFQLSLPVEPNRGKPGGGSGVYRLGVYEKIRQQLNRYESAWIQRQLDINGGGSHPGHGGIGDQQLADATAHANIDTELFNSAFNTEGGADKKVTWRGKVLTIREYMFQKYGSVHYISGVSIKGVNGKWYTVDEMVRAWGKEKARRFQAQQDRYRQNRGLQLIAEDDGRGVFYKIRGDAVKSIDSWWGNAGISDERAGWVPNVEWFEPGVDEWFRIPFREFSWEEKSWANGFGKVFQDLRLGGNVGVVRSGLDASSSKIQAIHGPVQMSWPLYAYEALDTFTLDNYIQRYQQGANGIYELGEAELRTAPVGGDGDRLPVVAGNRPPEYWGGDWGVTTNPYTVYTAGMAPGMGGVTNVSTPEWDLVERLNAQTDARYGLRFGLQFDAITGAPKIVAGGTGAIGLRVNLNTKR